MVLYRENIIVSQVSSIIRSSTYRVTANVANIIISISFMAYFARVFTKEQMAIYAALTVLKAWNDIITGLGLGTLLVKDATPLISSGNIYDAKRLITSVLVYRTSFLLILCCILIFIEESISPGILIGLGYSDIFNIIVLISFISGFSSMVSATLIPLQKFGTREVINVSSVLFQRIVCVVGFLSVGVIGFYYALIVSYLLELLVGLVVVRNYLTLHLIPFAQLFRSSRSYYGLEILRSGLDNLDRPVVAFFMGTTALADYHVAKRLFDNFYQLMLAIIVPAGVKFGELQVSAKHVLQEYYNHCLILVSHLFSR